MIASVPGRSTLIWSGISAVSFLLLWSFVSIIVDSPLILPSPLSTLERFAIIITGKSFIRIIASSGLRILGSFSIALFTGIAFGIPAGIWLRFEQLLSAPMRVMRAVPTMGIILLSLIWLDSEGAPYLVCALVILPLLYGGMVSSIRSIDSDLRDLHRIYEIPFLRKVLKFYLPAVLPSFRGSLAAALGLNVKVMIAAEVLSQPSIAIGTSFQIARAQLDTAGVFAWCFIVILMSSALDALLKILLPAAPEESLRNRTSKSEE
ncbi:ABC transporter permease [Salinispira pacifica]|nr:ABC transporter permease subunit [Salinispira pacifica]